MNIMLEPNSLRFRGGGPGRMGFALLVAIVGCRSPGGDPEWIEALGYTAEDVVQIEIAAHRFPYVPVTIAGTPLMLLFDTGNMVGVSVSSTLFDRLGLSSDGFWTFLGSGGEIRGSFRVANGVTVTALGRELGPTQVYEAHDPALAGLVGPDVLSGDRFTLDYTSRRMGVSTARAPDTVTGFRPVPLVRSSRHPTLILVRGTIEGRPVLIQLDTGKSRTVVDPALAVELKLRQVRQGVAIQSLRIGDLSFAVRSAREVDQAAIDPDLPEPVLVGIGSDILSGFAWTVDFEADLLWMPSS